MMTFIIIDLFQFFKATYKPIALFLFGLTLSKRKGKYSQKLTGDSHIPDQSMTTQ